jgi:hypothetical protein
MKEASMLKWDFRTALSFAGFAASLAFLFGVTLM